jgi:hypothetical protein
MSDHKGMFEPLNEEERDAPAFSPMSDGWTIVSPVPDNVPRIIPPNSLGEHSQIWHYLNEDGRLLFVMCRFETENDGKIFRPVTYCRSTQGHCDWKWKSHPDPCPLYGLNRLSEHPNNPVLIVEGEKTAEAAQQLFPDHVVMTSPCGSGAAGKTDWGPLEGRTVVIWPDNDEPGIHYANDVAKLASASGAASVAIVDIPGDFRSKWDLADALPDGWDKNKLQLLLDNAIKTDSGNLTDNGAAEENPDPIETLITKAATNPGVPFQPENLSLLSELQTTNRAIYETVLAKLKAFGVRIGELEKALRQFEKLECKNTKDSKVILREDKPWGEPCDGAMLLDEITDLIKRHLALPDHSAEVMALWALSTYAMDAFYISPRLAFVSPEKGCGKTTALSIMQFLVAKPLAASNLTTAVVFRVIEEFRPTLLIDEADTFLPNNTELRGILNSGHARANAFVFRMVGEDHQVQSFNTFAPIAIAMIGSLPDTLEDRSFVISMRRRLRSEHVEEFRLGRTEQFDILRRKAKRWAEDNMQNLKTWDGDVPEPLFNRVADNWRVLLAIADIAGGHWPSTTRKVAQAFSTKDDDGSQSTLLLKDIKALFDEDKSDRLKTQTILNALNNMEHRPWPEYRAGSPITAAQLARLLLAFGVISKTIRIAGEKSAKGYTLISFKDTFARYVPDEAVTPSQSNKDKGFEQKIAVTTNRNVTGKKLHNPSISNGCDGVTANKPAPPASGWVGIELPDFLDRRKQDASAT